MRRLTEKELKEWVLEELRKAWRENRLIENKLMAIGNSEKFIDKIIGFEILEKPAKRIENRSEEQQKIVIWAYDVSIFSNEGKDKVIEKLKESRLEIDFCFLTKFSGKYWLIGEVFGKLFFVSGVYIVRPKTYEWVRVLGRVLDPEIYQIDKNEIETIVVFQKL